MAGQWLNKKLECGTEAWDNQWSHTCGSLETEAIITIPTGL